MKIIQANIHRSRTADALLDQIAVEKEVDACLISEQYVRTTRDNWFEDETRTAAIWLPNSSKIVATSSDSGPGFTLLKCDRFTLVSCYLTPSDSMQEFRIKLNQIEDKVRDISEPLIVAGDFNSRAVEWGMPSTNSRGRCVLEMAARLGLVVANTGSSTTFRRPGCIGSTPDITLISENLIAALTDWRVLEDFTGSDHQYITFRIEMDERRDQMARRIGTRVWNVRKLNPEILIRTVDENTRSLRPNEANLDLVESTMRCMTLGCNAAMPKLSSRIRQRSVYWWTDEIAELRRICLRKRRKLTRAKRNGAAIEESEDFKRAKRELKMAINRSKKLKWEELRNDLNNNPRGLGYKVVVRKLGAKASLPQLDSSTMANIVNTLFPTHEIRMGNDMVDQGEDPPPSFSTEELQTAAQSLKSKKAPGPDGIPSEVLKLVAKERPQVLLNMYNTCLRNGVFPARWKKQQLILISKGKGDPSQASAYRPLCMLDSSGKLLERLLKLRLSTAVENSGGLSERQHGFRSGRSTIGAISEVIASVNAIQSRSHFSRPIALLATLDVRNAFNSLRWADVLDALRTKFAVPSYLMRILQSYLSDRVLYYETSEGRKMKQITSGAAQGSILGPDLWNVSYDDIFRIEMPDETYLVGYADDVAAVIIARNVEEARRKLNQVIIRTQSWLEDKGLQLATEKTEIILLTRKHIPLQIVMPICDVTLTTQKVVNYLGIRLDPRLTFWAQIQYAATKAAKVAGLLSKLMANVGGPLQSRRRLMMETINSILLYGSEIWADALKADSKVKVLSSVQRTAALRVASAYRTVSRPAVLVISGVIPIDLQAAERKKLWVAKNAFGQRLSAKEERRQTLQQWQQRWDSEEYGRWTAKLIPSVTRWVERKFGETDYYLTQLLSGHGYFCKYLSQMGKMEGPKCIYGDAEIDDAENTFFRCVRWSREKANLEVSIGRCTVDNFCDKILQNEENWKRIAVYAAYILKIKKEDLDRRAVLGPQLLRNPGVDE